MSSDEHILLQREGTIGHIVLNRPRSMNALTLEMIDRMSLQLSDWAGDDLVKAILIEGAGENAFCAGGDILNIYKAREGGGNGLAASFFPAEYRLNRQIKRYPKTYIALMNGVVMGGGVGVSVHGSQRIVAENTLLAMPETGIGLYPDVGATYFLSRMKGNLGFFIGLTGWRLKAADCLFAGLATHFVESEKHGDLKRELQAGGCEVDQVLSRFAGAAGPSEIADVEADISRIFAESSVEAIMDALSKSDANWAGKALSLMERASPTSLKLTFDQIKRGASLDFENCLRQELRLTYACLEGHDFYEGVRAVLIDKDYKPAWKPANLSEVSKEKVEAAFSSIGDRELHFD